MNDDYKLALALALLVFSFSICGGSILASYKTIELKEKTKQEVYRNWDKFSELEKQKLINQ